VIIGMASAVHYINPDKAPQLFINEVGVSPHFRGQGLGRRLVAELLRVARSKGCTEAWVLTDAENAAARAMYAAAGGQCSAQPQLMFSFPLGGAID
jgi:aminoglycoside 6'-N-acetyltransferase I